MLNDKSFPYAHGNRYNRTEQDHAADSAYVCNDLQPKIPLYGASV